MFWGKMWGVVLPRQGNPSFSCAETQAGSHLCGEGLDTEYKGLNRSWKRKEGRGHWQSKNPYWINLCLMPSAIYSLLT